MQYRLLGRTNLNASRLALGTVELGTTYGIRKPDESPHPDSREAIYLLQYAAGQGINLFDTAPVYGDSEKLLGKALGPKYDCYFATKVSVPRSYGNKMVTGDLLRKAIDHSLVASLRALKRDWLDIVQIHNATAELITQGEFTEALLKARETGKIRFLGASVYGVEAAQAVVSAGCFDILQLAYNLLDQRMAPVVFPQARRVNMGIVCRSALLKGVLTERSQWLPPELAPLRQQAEKAKQLLAGVWTKLPLIALRFCLSSPHIDTVLVGGRNQQELGSALEAISEGLLGVKELELAAGLSLSDERLLDPSYWPVP